MRKLQKHGVVYSEQDHVACSSMCCRMLQRYRMLGAVVRLSGRVDVLCRTALFVLGTLMTLVIGAQVFFRYGLNASLFWSEELGRVLLVQLTFLGTAVAYKAGAHIGISVFVARAPLLFQIISRIIVHTACALFFLVMLVYGYQFSTILATQMTTTLGISKQLPFFVIPASGAIMLLHMLADVCPFIAGNDLYGKEKSVFPAVTTGRESAK